MNALILSAVLGVVMMFSGIVFKDKKTIRIVGIGGMIALLVVNMLEMGGTVFFNVDAKGMIVFDRFALLFDTIAILSALFYLLL